MLPHHRNLEPLALPGVCVVCFALGLAGENFMLVPASACAACLAALRGAQWANRRGAIPSSPGPLDVIHAETDDADALVDEMLAAGRHALLLRREIVENLSPLQRDSAREALERDMSLVPGGELVMGGLAIDEQYGDLDEEELPGAVVDVEAFLLDSFPVTNRHYQAFVDAGGYEQMAIWDPEILPAVLEFVDRTGAPGPRFWSDGRFPVGMEHHPVVGVSWYEAAAYARWIGKRLPSEPEWEKAGSWPMQLSAASRLQRKFPWGDAMQRSRCNVWGSGHGQTVPIDACSDGVSVGGVAHLTGNVWEWTTGNFGAWHAARHELLLPVAMKSIRGGAFDTYFDNQASCQFQSGEDPLARKHNIGFRCALSLADVETSFDRAAAALESAEPTWSVPQQEGDDHEECSVTNDNFAGDRCADVCCADDSFADPGVDRLRVVDRAIVQPDHVAARSSTEFEEAGD